MTVRVGNTIFNDIDYDREADVLYMSVDAPKPAADSEATHEGHVVRWDNEYNIIGITIVGAAELLKRDGEIKITVPEVRHINADKIAPALAA